MADERPGDTGAARGTAARDTAARDTAARDTGTRDTGTRTNPARGLAARGLPARGIPAREHRLDPIDHALIAALQQDGRASYATLAKEVGLSEAAVRQRVQRLLDTAVMQIVAVTDPMTVNLARQAMVGVRVEGDSRVVAKALTELTHVDYVVICAGSFDLLCEITCEDDRQLLAVLNDGIRGIPGVLSTESFVYLSLAKQTYAWGALTRSTERLRESGG